jgi:hypothetical protein
MAGSWRRPRCPLLCLQGQGTAIRLAVSLQMMAFTYLLVGSPKMHVRIG